MPNPSATRAIVNAQTADDAGAQQFILGPGGVFDANGQADALVLDSDADTTISAPTDDQIDIEIAGADDFTFTANSFNVLSGSSIDLADSCNLIFGTGDDIQLAWDGSGMTAGPSSGMWAGCPSRLDPSPYRFYEFFDDFFVAPTDANLTWLEVDDGTTGTNSISDTAGGVGTVVTAGADNDYHAITSRAESFNLAGTKELWFEARFRLTEANTNESAWWFGLTDTLTTGGFQANNGGPLASYDGVLVWKDEGTLEIDVEASNASTQDTETNIATFASGTWTRVAFHVSADATTAVVTAYFDVNDSGVLTAHSATMNLTRSGLEEMHLVAGVKAGPSAGAETLEIDYIRCVQIR